LETTTMSAVLRAIIMGAHDAPLGGRSFQANVDACASTCSEPGSSPPSRAGWRSCAAHAATCPSPGVRPSRGSAGASRSRCRSGRSSTPIARRAATSSRRTPRARRRGQAAQEAPRALRISADRCSDRPPHALQRRVDVLAAPAQVVLPHVGQVTG
jgi:hypothetical protein